MIIDFTVIDFEDVHFTYPSRPDYEVLKVINTLYIIPLQDLGSYLKLNVGKPRTAQLT